MASFPVLQTGAVAQYPIQMGTGQSVSIVRFIDGSDQRFLNIGKQYRRWRIQLNLLSDVELNAVQDFFLAQKGVYSTFTFPDPLSGSQIPNCRIASAELITEYLRVGAAATELWVTETNG